MVSAMQTRNASRKSHNKTRSGCRTCKRRKIKCDEQRPSCKNCVKHSVQCDYTSANSRQFVESLHPGRLAAPHSGGVVWNSEESASEDLVSRQHSSLGNIGQQRLSMTDLELLHNYCYVTYHTLSSLPLIRTVWRINVPQLGFSHEFVMRCILALSALHMAHSDENKREHFLGLATMHNQIAIQTAMPLLNKVTPEISPSLYMFSVLTMLYATASPRQPGDFLLVGATGVVPDWLYLLRGTKSILDMSKQTLQNSTLGPMFSDGRRRAQRRDATTSQELHLEELRVLIIESVGQPAADIYTKTIEDLQRSFSVACDITNGRYKFKAVALECVDVFVWPFIISDEYISYLQQLEPEALAILAHYCVLLRFLDDHWWMQGWSTHLIALIYSSLDEEHRLWIRWPIEEVGWVPSRS